MIAECRRCGGTIIIATRTDPCPECRRLRNESRPSTK